MNLYINNHSFHYELENLTRLFYPNEKIKVIKDSSDFEKPFINTQIADKLIAEVSIGDFYKKSESDICIESENERMLCEMVYKILCELTDVTPPWGMITGVRPVKLYRQLKKNEGGEKADAYFRDKLFVSPKKVELLSLTESIEKKIIDLSHRNSFSLYISIPFCPSRCYYCSFVQSSVERCRHLVEPYVELLCREIEYTAEIAANLGLRLETVYMGGGTPTTLSPEQMSRVLSAVNSSFDTSSLREFTVEAGRPDTITKDKLISIIENKVDRISINPQTLNDEILDIIGRKHTASQTIDAYKLAREVGFNSINMDLIAGLPEESAKSFVDTLNRVCALDPECITVHTLSMKRSSTLTQDGTAINRSDAVRTSKMLDYAFEKLVDSGYLPYYLYRQTRMVGNLENTGWSKPGFESLYNIYVMDETHTILGCGAGAVTKLKSPDDSYLKRVFNFKYPYEYINRYSEQLERKKEIYTFYEKYI
ncbi:MAG: coproporphyrinogen dehydrogenase HemZ [Ruminococcus sp.]|nr:coproporphyrinogen dehydrogenase HemZ [Ruminococcus sp.]